MRSNPLRWLLLAGAIHITLTLGIFLVGHFQILPSVVDVQGTGLTFAIDATSYRSLASRLAFEWETQGFASWLAFKAPLHCRLYSVMFVTLGRLLGHNILAAEPLNLLYYLGILSCVYWLGCTLFCSRAGLLAGIVVGVWPSFLLHTTQLIRDPLSILCLLALVLLLTLLLQPEQDLLQPEQDLLQPEQVLLPPEQDLFQPEQDLFQPEQVLLQPEQVLLQPEQVLLQPEQVRKGATPPLSWRTSVALGLAGAALVTLFWVVRGNMWNIVIVAVAITLALLVCRMILLRRLLLANLLAITLTVIAMLLAPSRLESTSLAGVKPPVTPLAIPSATQPAQSENVLTRAFKQIGERRSGFRSYRARESDVDRDVRLDGAADVLKFVPRATLIGFLAPFPRMWFERGSYGFAGRLLSGVEMLVMYFVYCGAFVCAWRNRRRLEVWLIFVVATIGTIALGLVVMNAGALYRLRYVFWIMFIIMAVETLTGFSRLTGPGKHRSARTG